jgi:hypothetical protein
VGVIPASLLSLPRFLVYYMSPVEIVYRAKEPWLHQHGTLASRWKQCRCNVARAAIFLCVLCGVMSFSQWRRAGDPSGFDVESFTNRILMVLFLWAGFLWYEILQALLTLIGFETTDFSVGNCWLATSPRDFWSGACKCRVCA